MNDLIKEKKRINPNILFEGYDPNFGEPYFLYPKANNLPESELIKNFEQNLSLTFIKEKESLQQGEVCFMNSPEVRPEFRVSFTTIDIFDYVYAILYSSSYREKYKMKVFPQVPYPTDASTFWRLAALGSELRQMHLLECTRVEKLITQFPVTGNNVINQIDYRGNKVFINETQYFENVPKIAWDFTIGDDHPAQKWLLNRKGSKLSLQDILLYQKIIVALKETDRVMEEIDKIKAE